jgi:hypothetical protein
MVTQISQRLKALIWRAFQQFAVGPHQINHFNLQSKDDMSGCPGPLISNIENQQDEASLMEMAANNRAAIEPISTSQNASPCK